MAKGKHATALFEVIHAAKRPPKSSSSGGIPTPKWWFKNRNHDAMLAAPKMQVFSPKAEVIPEPPPRIIERIVERPVYIEREPAPLRIAPPAPMGLETNDGEIKFKLSYGGAAGAAFVLAMMIALAYLAGTRSSQQASADDIHVTAGETTASAGSQTPQTRASGFLAAVSPSLETSSHRTIVNASPAQVPVAKVITAAAPEAAATEIMTAGKVTRQAGLTYVIAQSYPGEEFANKACEFLNKSGIPATVEAGPPGWAMKGWYSVIGAKSFDHIQKNTDLENYKQAIEAAGAKFTGSSRFNRFEPKLYKWRGDSDAK